MRNCASNATYRAATSAADALLTRTCRTVRQDNKRNYICSRKQLAQLGKIAIAWPDRCESRPLPELLQERLSARPRRLCFVGDSFVWQMFYGLECQLHDADLVLNRSVDGTFHSPGTCATDTPDCRQPTGITTTADGLELRFVFTAFVSDGSDTSKLAPDVSPPWCSMAWPLSVETLRRQCGEVPPDALLFNLGVAHCVMHAGFAHERPMNRSGLNAALQRAAAVVAEYTSGGSAWLVGTYRTHKSFAWSADVEATFAAETRALHLLDTRSLTTRPPAAVLSDGMHFCIPGVPSALMNAWMSHSSRFE